MNVHLPMYERITELVSLLNDYDFEPTIRRISTATDTSLPQTREDLAQLHRLGIRLYPEEIADRLNRDDSQYDDEVLGLDMELPVSGPLLFLNRSEADLFRTRNLRSLLIKDSPYSVPDAVKRRTRQIEEAIRQGCYVNFLYRSPVVGTSERIEAAPQMLFHNTTDDLYYLLTIEEDGRIFSYRLDRMLFDIRLVKGRSFTPMSEDQRTRLTYAWGAAFHNDEAPVHVKIRISADTPNILTKIRSDTHDRVHGRLYSENDYYVYEDDVIGLASFRAWLLPYGASVKVLEPQSLAVEILQSSKLRLLNYEDGNRFHPLPSPQ